MTQCRGERSCTDWPPSRKCSGAAGSRRPATRKYSKRRSLAFLRSQRLISPFGSITLQGSRRPAPSPRRSYIAWLYRARQLGRALKVQGKFSAASLNSAVAQLAKLKRDVEEARHIPRVLSESGIRFLIVEPLPHTKIDGVCFWLDAGSPVIALSVRYDRIDWFWPTLMHEIAHVKNKDGMESPTD